MAVFAAIAFATLFLKHDDFVALDELTLDFAYYFGAFYGGCAYLDGTVGVYQKHTVKLYCGAFGGAVAEIVDIKELVLFSFELLALNFYDYVHLFVVTFCMLAPSGEAHTLPQRLLTRARAKKYALERRKVTAFSATNNYARGNSRVK